MDIVIPDLNFMALAPQIIVLAMALFILLLDLWIPDKEELGALSVVGLIIAAAIAFSQWSQPAISFQGMAVADGYSSFLNLIFTTVAALSILISIDFIKQQGMNRGEYYALMLFATAGMMLMGAATNLTTIFLGLEILSIPLYVLAGFNRADERSGEAALKYFLLGAFASAFLLYGMALTYGATGYTGLTDILSFLKDPATAPSPILWIGLALFVVGFGFKIALVPFHMWTPDVYQGAPTPVTAFMSVGAKAAGFAALIRVLGYAFGQQVWTWGPALAVLAVLTMTIGNVAALSQRNVKRMLAYSSIAHAGYLLVGLTADNQAGLAAVLFYLLAYIFMNVGAFAVLIALGRGGEPGEELDDFAGLGTRKPWLAAAMAVFMLSLAGVPPLAGFLGKFYLFSAAVESGWLWLAIFGVLNSVLSAFFYLRVLVFMYMKDTERKPLGAMVGSVSFVLAVAVVGLVLLGVWPSPVMGMVQQSVLMVLGK